MKLDLPFLQLPVTFDAERLAAEVAALPANAWRAHPNGYPGNDALSLIGVDGDADSDAVRGPMRPTPHLERCAYLQQVLAHLGAVWGRTRLMRLSGQSEVTPHVDVNYYWREHLRVHVPIQTQPAVRFHCGDAEAHMAAGECWIFDTWRLHKVVNHATEQRIHLVADTVGGPGFWSLAEQGRPHHASPAGWSPVRFNGSETAPLLLESHNLPAVMSPVEVREHLNFIADEAPPSPGLDAYRQLVAQFCRLWQARWAQHGDGGAGLDDYRLLRSRMDRALEPLSPLVLRNGIRLVNAVRTLVLKNLLADAPTAHRPPAPAASAPAIAALRAPILLLSPPRSGSTLLFETLAQSPDVCTVGNESHAVIERIRGLHPADRGYHSNQLRAQDAGDDIVRALRDSFAQSLRDRAGQPVAADAPLRLLEKTPKNCLRVGFLERVFPDAQLVFLYRDPRQVLSSMLEAWRSGRFHMYAELPDWTGMPWSLLLVPGWEALRGQPLEHIVAQQWNTTMRLLLDDLERLPKERVQRLRYDALLADPSGEIQRLCAALGISWDRPLGVTLPPARHTVSAPAADKWKRHQREIDAVWPLVREQAERALALAHQGST